MATLVVGAGFAGLSTAWHLAKAGEKDVTVLERDSAPALHASGKNAGMIRQAVADPMLAQLAREGRAALDRASKSGWKGLFDGKGGSLFTVSHADGLKLEEIAAACKNSGIPTERLSKEEAAKLSPLLAGARIVEALHCPTDGLVDIAALRDGFLKELEKLGVPVLYGRPLRRIARKNGRFFVETGRETLQTDKIVNAAGAWAADVAKLAGAVNVPLKAYRRHLYLTDLARPVKGSWPFVWDLSRELYFRPSGAKLLLSPCDKVFSSKRSESPDTGMKRLLDSKIENFSPRFPRYRVQKSQAALRTMTPDGRFVIGADPKVKGFFWNAGLGGHGVTVSFSAGRLAADAARGKKTGALGAAHSPARFA